MANLRDFTKLNNKVLGPGILEIIKSSSAVALNNKIGVLFGSKHFLCRKKNNCNV